MKIILIIIAFTCTVSVYGNHTIIPDSTVRYTKTIEPNRLDASDSVSHKTRLDKRFFGDFNARLEFLLEPPFKSTIGLRIYKMPNNTSFMLEAKRVSNYQEINKQVDAEFPTENTNANVFLALSKAEQQRRLDYNEKVYEKRSQERLKLFKTESITIPLSDSLANKLYDKTTELLRAALLVGKSPYTIFDGETMTYRCVVDDNEVWTLKYHVPEGDFKALSDLFRRMIADVEAGTFDEAKYLKMLGDGSL